MNTPLSIQASTAAPRCYVSSSSESGAATARTPARLAGKGAGLLLLLFALLAGLASTANAQFTGPALMAPPPSRETVVPTTSTALLHPRDTTLHLQPGDVVAVHLYGSPEYTPLVRVSLDGTMQLPLIGVISVKGLTLDQTEDLIASRLKTLGMYNNPQVTVDVTESAASSVTVSGELHAVVPVSGERSLLQILAVAGGLPPTASRVISIDRPGVAKPIVVDLGTDPLESSRSNIPVFPGDTIITSRVGVVYLLGSFRNVGAVPIVQSSPLTLLEVASLGGGPRVESKYSDLRIIRTDGNKRTLLKVDMMKVMKGHAPDPILQADDIVYLPNSLIKSLITSGGLSVLLGVASVALYATSLP